MNDGKHFKVAVASLSVRAEPNPNARWLGSLTQGTTIAVVPGSQRTVEGFVWWQHSLGWSAEKNLSNGEVFLEPVAAASSSPQDSLTFVITNGPLSVRSGAGVNEAYLTSLPTGTELQVRADSSKQADGFVWWQHGTGWSAEKTADGSRVFMERVNRQQPPPPPAPTGGTKTFRVVLSPLSILETPGLNIPRIGRLRFGNEIVADAQTRTEKDGHVWWRHDRGWSAEKTVDGSRVFMELIAESPGESPVETSPPVQPPVQQPPPVQPPTPPTPPPVQPPVQQPPPVQPPAPDSLTFRVLQNLSIRTEPSINAERDGQFYEGDFVTVDPSSLKLADGFMWWRHDRGWSAERSLNDGRRFMEVAEDGPPPPLENEVSIPLPDGSTIRTVTIFERLPVDLAMTTWIQYFGNTVFAYRLRTQGRFWYNYSQGLHGGFDFGVNRGGVPIYAGVQGEIQSMNRGTTVYAPNYAQVRAGAFTIIYGHAVNLRNIERGQPVTPDTVLCDVEVPTQNHLHLEVRYANKWIINPLALMPDALRTPIFQRFSDYNSYFFRDATWNQWLKPLDQPALRLGGSIAGPHGPR